MEKLWLTVILIPIVIGVAVAGFLAGEGATSSKTSVAVVILAPTTSESNSTTVYGSITKTTSTRTCTDIPNLSYTYCASPLRISAVGQANGSDWNYTVTIGSDDLVQGQTVQLVANLTNLGQNTTLEWVEPYINPSVNAENGTQLWAWDPSQVTWQQTVATGETISQPVDIPTSQLLAGQTYLIEVAPISLQFPTPNGLTFAFQLSVEWTE